ncbi:MAG TPA: TolC family protein, partial [Rhizomicrobium sp.]
VVHMTAQEAALREQVSEAEKVLNAAQRKYKSGYVDFLIVTEAERSLNAARDQFADTRRARLAALIALYKALGGGWSAGTG